jgi:hypothetical protein
MDIIFGANEDKRKLESLETVKCMKRKNMLCVCVVNIKCGEVLYISVEV